MFRLAPLLLSHLNEVRVYITHKYKSNVYVACAAGGVSRRSLMELLKLLFLMARGAVVFLNLTQSSISVCSHGIAIQRNSRLE